MNFIANMDYSWRSPQTYLVFVPALSLVIQKIQMKNILPFSEIFLPVTAQDQAMIDYQQEHKQFVSVCKWHLGGSTVQWIASAIALKVFSAPIFALFALIALGEFAYTCKNLLSTTATHYEFYPNGNLKMISSSRGFAHFW